MKKISLIIILCATGCFIEMSPAYSRNNRQQEFICFASPTKRALERCQMKGTCRGAGTFGVHPSEMQAARLALQLCDKEYESVCDLDYCEKK